MQAQSIVKKKPNQGAKWAFLQKFYKNNDEIKDGARRPIRRWLTTYLMGSGKNMDIFAQFLQKISSVNSRL